MALYGLLIVAFAVASLIYVANLVSILSIANAPNVYFEKIEEMYVIYAYAHYLSAAPGEANSIGAFSGIAGLNISCTNSFCLIENRYKTAYVIASAQQPNT